MKSAPGKTQKRHYKLRHRKNQFGKGRGEDVVLPPHYKYINDLGEGNYGIVVKALNERTNNIVAIKYMPIDGKVPDALYYAMRETEILVRYLQNPNCQPNLLCMYEHFANRGMTAIYIVTEFIDGIRLSDLVARSGIFLHQNATELSEFWFMCVQLFTALEYIHYHGVAHRDLHVMNIILQNDRMRIKIIDFGLACAVASKDPTIACRDNERSNVHFMAPEVIHGKLMNQSVVKYFLGSDIWALGMTLHYIVTNRYPINLPGTANGPLPQKMMHLFGTTWKISNSQEFHFSAIKHMVAGMLNFDPTLRPNATALKGLAISKWKESLGVDTITDADIKPMAHLWAAIPDIDMMEPRFHHVFSYNDVPAYEDSTSISTSMDESPDSYE